MSQDSTHQEPESESEADERLTSRDLLALSERLKARAENAYIDMIGAARKDEALGWEIKVERGTFGRPELDAHSAIAEKLGRHRALMEAHNLLVEILRANADVDARIPAPRDSESITD